MDVILTKGNEEEKIFTHVEEIIQHNSEMIELKFTDKHPYPANEVYLGLNGKVDSFKVVVNRNVKS